MAKKRDEYVLNQHAHIPEVSDEFAQNLQSALLLSLLEQNFLTMQQYERCMAALKKIV